MSHTGASSQIHRMLTREYGSRRGFVRTYWHRFLYYLGRYRCYSQVDWQSVERLVFVCKGNICRSAYAEAVARSLDIEAVSCGLDAVVGAPADEAAARIARERGFSLDEHKSTPMTSLQLRDTDLLVAMEPWQTEFLRENLLSEHSRTLLGIWTRPVFPFIQDPFGYSPVYFDKCFERIEDSVYEITKKVKKPGS